MAFPELGQKIKKARAVFGPKGYPPTIFVHMPRDKRTARFVNRNVAELKAEVTRVLGHAVWAFCCDPLNVSGHRVRRLLGDKASPPRIINGGRPSGLREWVAVGGVGASRVVSEEPIFVDL